MTPGDEGPRFEGRILFIMGTARSGSTILAALLGNAHGVLCAGEVGLFFADGFVDNAPCACGHEVRSCDAWGGVYRDVRESASSGDAIVRAMDRHTAFFRVVANLFSSQRWQQYRRVNAGVFAHLATPGDVRCVVDSSKYAARALALARVFPGKVKVICLTREPLGLIDSFKKPNKTEQLPKSRFAVLSYYGYVLLCLAIARYVLGAKCVAIRYEDFVAEPARVLREIEQLCEIDLSRATTLAETQAPFRPGHIVTGNRLRHNQMLRIHADRPEARLAPDWRTRLTVSLMHGWRRLLGF